MAVEVAGRRSSSGGRASGPRTDGPAVGGRRRSISGARCGRGLPGYVVSRMFLARRSSTSTGGEDLLQITSIIPLNLAAGERVSLHLPADGIPLLPGAST